MKTNYSLKDKKWFVKTALEISNVNFNDVCIMLKILENYKDRITLFYDNYTFNPCSIELSLNNLRKKRIFIDLGSDYKNEISIEILLKLFNYLLSNKSIHKFLKLYKIYNEVIEFEYFNELFCIYTREKINQSGKNKILL